MTKKYLDNTGLSYFWSTARAGATEVDAIFDEYDTTSVFLIASTSAWETAPYCYVWNDTQQQAYKQWYGEAMTLTDFTYDGHPVYKYTYPTDEYDKCIFTQNGTNQTSDLVAQPGKAYNPSTSSWVDMRTNPLNTTKVVSMAGLIEYNDRIQDILGDIDTALATITTGNGV